MSSENLEKVIQRAISDAAFRRLLQSDPSAALRGFKLTGEEKAALSSGDAGKLMSLGIDQRMSKTFSVGAEMGGASRGASDVELSAGASTVTDGDLAGAATRVGFGDPTMSARIDPGVESGATRIRDIAPGNPAQVDADANASRDALEDASIANAQARFTSDVNASRDALEDASIANAQARFPGEPNYGRDTLEDASISGAQERFAANQPQASAVRDSDPVDLRGQAGYGEGYPAHGGLAGPSQVTGSAATIRDSEPFEMRGPVAGEEALATTSGTATFDAGFVAGTQQTVDAGAAQIRDSEPVDLRGGIAASDEGQLTGSTAQFDEGHVTQVGYAQQPTSGTGIAADEIPGTPGYSAAMRGDLGGSVGSAQQPVQAGSSQVEMPGTPEYSAAARADLVGSTGTSQVEMPGTPEYSAGLRGDLGGSAAQIRDSDPVDLRGQVASGGEGPYTAANASNADDFLPEFSSTGSTDTLSRDQIEDLGHAAAQNAFMDSQEAAQVARIDPNLTSADGNTIDEGSVDSGDASGVDIARSNDTNVDS